MGGASSLYGRIWIFQKFKQWLVTIGWIAVGVKEVQRQASASKIKVRDV
jgi:hypothetical protein